MNDEGGEGVNFGEVRGGDHDLGSNGNIPVSELKPINAANLIRGGQELWREKERGERERRERLGDIIRACH